MPAGRFASASTTPEPPAKEVTFEGRLLKLLLFGTFVAVALKLAPSIGEPISSGIRCLPGLPDAYFPPCMRRRRQCDAIGAAAGGGDAPSAAQRRQPRAPHCSQRPGRAAACGCRRPWQAVGAAAPDRQSRCCWEAAPTTVLPCSGVLSCYEKDGHAGVLKEVVEALDAMSKTYDGREALVLAGENRSVLHNKHLHCA